MNNTDNFSFSRIFLLWEFYRSGIMRHWMICAIATIICYALMQLAVFGSLSLKLYALATSTLGFVLYFAPLLFTRYRDRRFEIQIPATASEKTVFTVVYCALIIPFVTMVVWFACEGIAALFGMPIGNIQRVSSESMVELQALGFSYNQALMNIVNILQNTLITMATLYAVISAHRNRTLWGVITPFIAMISISIISSIYGIYVALKTAEVADENSAEFMQTMIQSLSFSNQTIIIGMTALIILNVATIYLIYRKFLRIQA